MFRSLVFIQESSENKWTPGGGVVTNLQEVSGQYHALCDITNFQTFQTFLILGEFNDRIETHIAARKRL